MDLRKRAALVGVSLAGASPAFAAVPAAFTTAVTDATADAVSMATALLGIAAGVVVVMIALKFIWRIKSAS